MKVILAAILISTTVYAGPCDEAWKHAPARDVCRLEWAAPATAAAGVELVTLPSGCTMEGGNPEDCAVLRACGPGKAGDKGASVFRRSAGVSSYCVNGKESEAFAPSRPGDPLAYVTCAGPGKPTHVRLESPDRKHTKECPFPFSQP